jgi:DNA invertase Pin-like site-specific DNA recombinase
MLAHCAEHGVATIVLESASRFSRDLLIQESGFAMLRKQGTTLIAADDPDAFTSDTPTAVMVRQILGAVSEFEKNGLVAKLKGARDRRSAVAGKRIEGVTRVPTADMLGFRLLV